MLRYIKMFGKHLTIKENRNIFLCHLKMCMCQFICTQNLLLQNLGHRQNLTVLKAWNMEQISNGIIQSSSSSIEFKMNKKKQVRQTITSLSTKSFVFRFYVFHFRWFIPFSKKKTLSKCLRREIAEKLSEVENFFSDTIIVRFWVIVEKMTWKSSFFFDNACATTHDEKWIARVDQTDLIRFGVLWMGVNQTSIALFIIE